MFKKVKEKIASASKETLKEEIQKHTSEILCGTAIVLLLYLCVKVNGKPVIVNVNVNGAGLC